MWRGSSRPELAPQELTPPQAATLSLIAATGPRTRPELTTESGLSAPTVIHAIDALEEQQLVRVVESRQGARGRAAQVYALGPRAGWSIGLDLGTSHLEFVALDLAGGVVSTRRLPHQSHCTSRTVALEDEARAELRSFCHAVSRQHGPLRAAGVATATIVPLDQRFFANTADSGQTDSEPATGIADEDEADQLSPSFDLQELVESLGLPPSLQLVLENNINCSALSEAHRPGREAGDLVYLHLGTGGVGIGIVSGGKLVRGAHGAAGEMRWFPYPNEPHADAPQASFDLEWHLGAAGLLQRAAPIFGNRTPSITEFFSLAESAVPPAEQLLRDYAADVARALMAFISVLDPEAAVLGGGIGNNPGLVRLVSEELRALGRPMPLSGDLGETSSALGAGILGVHQIHRILGLRSSAFARLD